jgi:hypothetical protein
LKTILQQYTPMDNAYDSAVEEAQRLAGSALATLLF